MYDGYPTWAARAYLKSAECLNRLNLRVDAIKTLEEMLAHRKISKTPEAATAREQLEMLKGGS